MASISILESGGNRGIAIIGKRELCSYVLFRMGITNRPDAHSKGYFIHYTAPIKTHYQAKILLKNTQKLKENMQLIDRNIRFLYSNQLISLYEVGGSWLKLCSIMIRYTRSTMRCFCSEIPASRDENPV